MWVEPMVIQRARVDSLATKLTRPHDFYVNCGGHAFGVDGWYIPADKEDLFQDFYTARNNKGGWRSLERKFVKNILRDFPGLKLLKKESVDNVSVDLDRYEIIAFRIRRTAVFADYHFMRCEKNGDWTEKRGSRRDIFRYNYEDIYDVWGEYDGKLYFFVRERR